MEKASRWKGLVECGMEWGLIELGVRFHRNSQINIPTSLINYYVKTCKGSLSIRFVISTLDLVKKDGCNLNGTDRVDQCPTPSLITSLIIIGNEYQ